MFSEKTIAFLAENAIRNSREWFNENKALYTEYVLEPLMELVVRLSPTVHNIDPLLICEPRVDRSISRIYRDVRFSRDKSLFRDVMWTIFIRDKKIYQGLPAFFFELGPGGFRYGAGYYIAGTDTMESIRSMILKNDPAFKKARATYEAQDLFSMEGEKYKRKKYPDMPLPVQEWLDRKTICFIHDSTDMAALYSEDLPDTIAEGFKLLVPIYNFLIKAEERK